MTPAWLLRRTVLELRRQASALSALFVAFTLAAVLVAGYRLARPMMPDLAADALSSAPAEVIGYLREDLPPSATQALRDALAQLPGVEKVKLVTPEEALRRLRQQLGDRGRLLDGAEDGLLPTSLEVWMAPANERAADPAARARKLAWRLQRVDGIVEVDVVEAQRDQRVAAWSRVFGRTHVVLMAATLLGAVVVLLFGGAAGRNRHRAEMQVLLSLGFTRPALVLPAVLLGVAAALLGTAAGLVMAHVGWGAAVAAWPGPVAPFGAAEKAIFLGVGGALGALTGLSTGHIPDLVDAR